MPTPVSVSGQRLAIGHFDPRRLSGRRGPRVPARPELKCARADLRDPPAASALLRARPLRLGQRSHLRGPAAGVPRKIPVIVRSTVRLFGYFYRVLK